MRYERRISRSLEGVGWRIPSRLEGSSGWWGAKAIRGVKKKTGTPFHGSDDRGTGLPVAKSAPGASDGTGRAREKPEKLQAEGSGGGVY